MNSQHSSSVPNSTDLANHTVGLVNVGNTCFLNSVLQVLRLCPPLVTLPPRSREGSKKAPLLNAFQAFLHDISQQPSDSRYVPTPFVAALLRTVVACDDDWYQPRQQADAAECLQYILDGLHDALYRRVRITYSGTAHTVEEQAQMKALSSWGAFFEKEYSPIVQHFYGQHQLQVRCEGCGTVTERYEPWCMLKVPIPGATQGSAAPSLVDCLNAFYAPETIEDYACDTCASRQRATLRTRISKFPNILLLSLKRFTNTGAKIHGLVGWNTDALAFQSWAAFQRSPFHDSPGSSSSSSSSSSLKGVFETTAIVEHQGSARSGHYRMFARAGSKTWTGYDDEAVFKGLTDNDVVSGDSYILVMRPVAAAAVAAVAATGS